MTDFDEHTLNKLIQLSRIACSDAEKLQLQANLTKILHYIEKLDSVDTEGVEPCYRVLEGLNNVIREDLVGDLLSREAFLANSPSHVGGMIRVPPIITNKHLDE